MATTPNIQSGTLGAPATYTNTVGNPGRSYLVENLDVTDSFTVAINGSNPWTLRPGTRISDTLPKDGCMLTLAPVSGSPAFQLYIV